MARRYAWARWGAVVALTLAAAQIAFGGAAGALQGADAAVFVLGYALGALAAGAVMGFALGGAVDLIKRRPNRL